jgi:HlyD family secretion protein
MSHKQKWLKRIALGLVLGVVVTGTALAMRPSPIAVQTGRLVRGPLVVTVDGTGRTRMVNKQTLFSPVTGTLNKITLRPGDSVRTGQTLAEILPGMPQPLDARGRTEALARLGAARAAITEAQHNVQRAELAFKLANDNAERMRSLFLKQAVTTSDLENAETESRTRRAELDLARTTAERVRLECAAVAASLRDPSKFPKQANEEVAVRSPNDGVVLRVHNESAGPVNVATPLLDLGDPKEVELVVDLPTQSATRIAAGARVRVDGMGNGVELDGRVKRVEPEAFTKVTALGVEEQRVNVIVVPAAGATDWSHLGDGFTADVHIETYRSEQALKAPAAAVFRQGDGYALFAVVESHARLTPVQTLARNADEVEIKSSLAVSAEVVIYPSDKLANGGAVAPE